VHRFWRLANGRLFLLPEKLQDWPAQLGSDAAGKVKHERADGLKVGAVVSILFDAPRSQ
jgi:hypothetical protein